MEGSIASKSSVGKKLKSETREFLILAAYLFVCFAAISYLKFAILRVQGVDFAPFGFAAVKAAICAKFMLFGRALHIEDRYKTHPLIVPTLYRAFAFLVLLIILMFIEEAVVGLIHGRSIPESIAETGGTLHEKIATFVLVFMILIPYFAFRSLGDVMGDGNPNASHPVNALLNYAYTIMQSQLQIRAVAEGYDPTLGIMHVDREYGPAFVFDLMEPERPKVDRVIIEFVKSETFHPADFTVRTDGVVRLNPQLARRVAALATGEALGRRGRFGALQRAMVERNAWRN